MGKRTSLGLKTLQWFVRLAQLLCAAIVLAIYSYFLAALANRGLFTPASARAVEGIAGLAFAYALFALFFLCCLAGRTLTSFAALCLDLAFLFAYVYVAVANRVGAGSCRGNLTTVMGEGSDEESPIPDKGYIQLPTYFTVCKMQTACLAVSVIAILLFIFSMLLEVAIGRHHQREKRLSKASSQTHIPFAPNPYKGYAQPDMASSSHPADRPTIAAFLSRIWARRNRHRDRQAVPPYEPPNSLPMHTSPDQVPVVNRDSNATAVDAGPGHDPDELHTQPPYNKYETGYGSAGNDVASPITAYSPAGTGQVPATPDAAHGYAHPLDPYAHARNSGDNYRHGNNGFHVANTPMKVPHYAAAVPYGSPYEPRRGESPPRYTLRDRPYDDGIYDRS